MVTVPWESGYSTGYQDWPRIILLVWVVHSPGFMGVAGWGKGTACSVLGIATWGGPYLSIPVYRCLSAPCLSIPVPHLELSTHLGGGRMLQRPLLLQLQARQASAAATCPQLCLSSAAAGYSEASERAPCGSRLGGECKISSCPKIFWLCLKNLSCLSTEAVRVASESPSCTAEALFKLVLFLGFSFCFCLYLRISETACKSIKGKVNFCAGLSGVSLPVFRPDALWALLFGC